MEQTLKNIENAETVFYRCVEDSFEPIMLTDIKGILRYVNPAWSLTYGYSRDEAVGQSPRLLRSQYQDDAFYRQMWVTILNPKIGFWRGEVINKSKDGQLVPVLLTITPYRDSLGEILGYMGIAVDLSEQKKMEQQIFRQDRLASIGMLASGLAHEVGNPIGVMRGRAELLLRQVKENPGATKNAEVIIEQIDRISKLITSLMQVSRVPDHVMLRNVNLENAVSEIFTLVSEHARKANVNLIKKNLSIDVLAEPGHLQQLLLNLVINATHAIEEKRERFEGVTKGEIEVSAAISGDRKTCAISIRDSGVGISAVNLNKLFQPFFTTKAAGKGTGMGLAVVSKLVEEMEGKVTVESSGEGHGSTFTVFLKIADRG